MVCENGKGVSLILTLSLLVCSWIAFLEKLYDHDTDMAALTDLMT